MASKKKPAKKAAKKKAAKKVATKLKKTLKPIDIMKAVLEKGPPKSLATFYAKIGGEVSIDEKGKWAPIWDDLTYASFYTDKKAAKDECWDPGDYVLEIKVSKVVHMEPPVPYEDLYAPFGSEYGN